MATKKMIESDDESFVSLNFRVSKKDMMLFKKKMHLAELNMIGLLRKWIREK